MPNVALPSGWQGIGMAGFDTVRPGLRGVEGEVRHAAWQGEVRQTRLQSTATSGFVLGLCFLVRTLHIRGAN